MTINTVSANDRRSGPFVATAGQTVFSYAFPIYDEEDLLVTRVRSGVQTTLTLAADYTVTGVNEEAGGTIVLTTGATLNDSITIASEMTLERTSYFQNGGDMTAEALNQDFNRLLMMQQERANPATSNVLIRTADDYTPEDMPTAGLRADTVLSFDANGDLVLAPIPTGTVTGSPPIWAGTAGGTANAITLTTVPAISAYAAGQEFIFIASATNTAATTINVSGVGAVAWKKGTASTDLAAGDVQSGALQRVVYDGTVFRTPTNFGTGAAVITDTVVWAGQATGTADVMIATPSPALAAYAAGVRVLLITPSAGTGNTGAVTLNVSSLGALAIRKGDGSSALVEGDLPPSTFIEVIHDGTLFRLLSIGMRQRSMTELFGQVYCGVSTGTSTAYTVAPPVTTLDYDRPFELAWKPHTACGAAPTITVGAVTKNLRKVNDAGTMTALAAGDLFTNQPVVTRYDPDLGHYVLVTPPANLLTNDTSTDAAWVRLSATSGTSAVATVDIELPSGYSRYRLDVRDVAPSSAVADLHLRFSTDNAVSYLAGTNYEHMVADHSGAGDEHAGSSGEAQILLTANTTNSMSSSARAFGHVDIDKANKITHGQLAYRTSAGLEIAHSMGVCGAGGTITHIRLLMSSGNIARYDLVLSGQV